MIPSTHQRKIRSIHELATVSQNLRDQGKSIVLCHGCFDIVHPGHLRYLQFARQQGDVLVVSLTGDDAIEKSDGTRPYIPQELRSENLAALEMVDVVVVVDGPTAEPVLTELKPDVYIKGREYEGSTHPGFLKEKELVENQGGRVIFSSGDVVFSSTAILDTMHRHLAESGFDETARLATCCNRWGVTVSSVRKLITEGFRGKRVAVVGDAINDRYCFCDANGVAGEAPMLSLRPVEDQSYLGGAAIIAAHLKALGAKPYLITTVGKDDASDALLDRLEDHGIAHTTLPVRRRLPEKLRYLVDGQKVLKVDHAEPQPLDSASERTIIHTLTDLAGDLDAVIFTDFGCGTVTASLLTHAIPALRPRVGTITGDVSGPRRTLMAFRDADLLAPNERELRGVAGDFESSLPTVAMSVMRELSLANLAVTMGPRGCILFRPREEHKADWFTSRLRSEYLPTLASAAVDPLGAGDALLSASTLALAAGASLTQAGYIGSAAAAIAVSRIGNHPVFALDLQSFLQRRPELLTHTQAAAG